MTVKAAPRIVVEASGTLARHRLTAFLVTAAGLLLMASAIAKVLPEDGQINVLTWIVLAAMAYSVVATVYMWRRMPADRRAFMAWATAQAPAMFGFAGALYGSAPIIMRVGLTISICLVAFALVKARPRVPEPPQPPSP